MREFWRTLWRAAGASPGMPTRNHGANVVEDLGFAAVANQSAMQGIAKFVERTVSFTRHRSRVARVCQQICGNVDHPSMGARSQLGEPPEASIQAALLFFCECVN